MLSQYRRRLRHLQPAPDRLARNQDPRRRKPPFFLRGFPAVRAAGLSGMCTRALVLLLGWVAAAAAAQLPGELDLARKFSATGAVQLALDTIERHQPAETTAREWAEWEALRCQVLATLQRDPDLLRRVAALPQLPPAPAAGACLNAAARAAFRLGDHAGARRHAARVLWQSAPPPERTQELRLLVIDSYVGQRQPEAAFRAMLRFQQDYSPLSPAVAARFVGALLDLGRTQDAVNWLARLDSTGPEALRLRWSSGLLAAAPALQAARAALAKSPAARGYWRVLYELGAERGEALLQVESLELALQQGDSVVIPAEHPLSAPAILWRHYLAAARNLGNQHQLLVGDDAAWREFANRRGNEPLAARAFFAYLTESGQSPETRAQAELQFVLALQNARLERVALTLFDHRNADVDTADLRVRHVLGTLAEQLGEPATALRWWHGLPPPPNVSAGDWILRVVRVAFNAGAYNVAADLLKQGLANTGPLMAGMFKAIDALALEAVGAGRAEVAQVLLEIVLPHAEGLELRTAYFSLGQVHAARGQAATAALNFMRSALVAPAAVIDSQLLQARLQAGINFARARYHRDARAQFEWLLVHSRDAAQLEIARRELTRLGRVD